MSIQVITKRDVIRGVRDKWLGQYRASPDEARLRWDHQRTFGDVRRSLGALDLEACESTDIDRAIGVTDWASLKCDECSADCELLVRIGDEPDYDNRWIDVCVNCLRTAVKMAESP